MDDVCASKLTVDVIQVLIKVLNVVVISSASRYPATSKSELRYRIRQLLRIDTVGRDNLLDTVMHRYLPMISCCLYRRRKKKKAHYKVYALL